MAIRVEIEDQGRKSPGSHRLPDRVFLQRLSDALDTSYQRIKLDGCRDWNIRGSKGHIFTDAKLWYVFVATTSNRRWHNIKISLSFMELSQDGDDEGVLKLERMPTAPEAKIIRKILGWRTKLTAEQRTKLLETSFRPGQKGV